MQVRKAMIYVLTACCVLLSVLSLTKLFATEPTAAVSGRTGTHILVLDAGHGGEDGGAVSVSGVAESGINLSIVLISYAMSGL